MRYLIGVHLAELRTPLLLLLLPRVKCLRVRSPLAPPPPPPVPTFLRDGHLSDDFHLVDVRYWHFFGHLRDAPPEGFLDIYEMLLLRDFLFLTVFHSFSPFSTVSHYFSPFLTVFHRFSLFFTVFHRFSLFLTVSHCFSPFLTVFHCFPPFFNIFHHFPLLLTVSLRFSLFFTVIHYFSPFFTVSLRGSMCCWPCWPGRPLGPVRPWVQYERRRIRTVYFVYFAADFCSNFAMKFRNGGGPNNLYK